MIITKGPKGLEVGVQALLYTLTPWHSRGITVPPFFLRDESTKCFRYISERERVPGNSPVVWSGCPPGSSALVSGLHTVSQIPVLSEGH